MNLVCFARGGLQALSTREEGFKKGPREKQDHLFVLSKHSTVTLFFSQGAALEAKPGASAPVCPVKERKTWNEAHESSFQKI